MMGLKKDANNNQNNTTSLTASRHSLKRFRALKSHKSGKSRSADETDTSASSLQLPSTSSSSSSALRHQLLSRPIEKVFEEAQLSLTLNLNDRKLKVLPEELASKYDLSDLMCAELANNRLTEMPDFLSSQHLDSLETLVLRKNCLRGQLLVFPVHLSNISYLDLSGNQLSSLPDCLFSLPLKVLLLSANRLDFLSPEISQVQDSLEELDVSFNRLKACPPGIGELNCLCVLSLRNNQIAELPAAISHLPQLRLLDVSNNQLSNLPSQLHTFAGALRSGIELQVDGNPLISPPIWVAKKGRLHIAKWLRNQAVHEINQNAEVGEVKKSIHDYKWNGVNTRRETVVGWSLKAHTKSSILPSKSAAIHSEPGKSFGSDSGYASTVDEHRFSHEYNTGSLEDICESQNREKMVEQVDVINEKQLCTGDLNKEIMLAYAQTVIQKKNATTIPKSTISCLKPTSNNNDAKFLPLQQATNEPAAQPYKTIAQYRQIGKAVSKCMTPCTSLLSPVLEGKTPNFESNSKSTLATTSAVKLNNTNQLGPKSLSSSVSPCSSMCSVIENLPTATIKIADTGAVLSKKGDPARSSKPLTTSASQPPKTGQLKGGIRNGTAKNPALVGKTDSKVLVTTAACKSAAVAKPAAAKSGLPTSNRVHPISNMSKSTITAAKQTPTGQRRVIKGNSIPPPETVDKTGVIKSVVNGKEIGVRKAVSTLNLPKSIAASSSPLAQAQAMAALVYEEQQKSLTSVEDMEKMMEELADGVMLCQLANRYRPKVVPIVLTPTAAEKTLPPPKARRNIENFLGACRRLGVPEAYICAATDIMGRQKSSAAVARTVIELSKSAKKKNMQRPE